mgnify:FL=1
MSDADKIKLFFAAQKKNMAQKLVHEIGQLLNNAVGNYNDCIAEHNKVVAEIRYNITKWN